MGETSKMDDSNNGINEIPRESSRRIGDLFNLRLSEIKRNEYVDLLNEELIPGRKAMGMGGQIDFLVTRLLPEEIEFQVYVARPANGRKNAETEEDQLRIVKNIGNYLHHSLRNLVSSPNFKAIYYDELMGIEGKEFRGKFNNV